MSKTQAEVIVKLASEVSETTGIEVKDVITAYLYYFDAIKDFIEKFDFEGMTIEETNKVIASYNLKGIGKYYVNTSTIKKINNSKGI